MKRMVAVLLLLAVLLPTGLAAQIACTKRYTGDSFVFNSGTRCYDVYRFGVVECKDGTAYDIVDYHASVLCIPFLF